MQAQQQQYQAESGSSGKAEPPSIVDQRIQRKHSEIADLNPIPRSKRRQQAVTIIAAAALDSQAFHTTILSP